MNRLGEYIVNESAVFPVHISSDHLYRFPFLNRNLKEVILEVIKPSAGKNINRITCLIIKHNEYVFGVFSFMEERVVFIDRHILR